MWAHGNRFKKMQREQHKKRSHRLPRTTVREASALLRMAEPGRNVKAGAKQMF